MFYNIFLRPINLLSFFSTALCHSNLLLPILFPTCSLKHHQSMWFLVFLFFFFQVEPILILFSEIYLLSFSLHGRTISIVYSWWNLLLNFEHSFFCLITLFLISSLLEILAQRLQKSISVEFNLLIVLDFNSHVSAPYVIVLLIIVLNIVVFVLETRGEAPSR